MVNKKAAMEMSVGTIVTIVLLMTVLILGLVLVRTIFSSSTENIDAIDEAVKSEITKLFSEDNTKKVVMYPADRTISVKKGEFGGFAFSIRNTIMEAGIENRGIFSYVVSASEVSSNCQVDLAYAESLIDLGKTNNDDIIIPSGDILIEPIHVNYFIPESTPLCHIRYNLNIQKDGQAYLPTITVDLEIK